MDKVTVNGEPVGETTGSTGVRWEDAPNRHAYCDGEIRRLRELAAEIIARHDAATACDQTPEDEAEIANWRKRAGLSSSPAATAADGTYCPGHTPDGGGRDATA